MSLVDAGDAERIEIGADHALAGAGLLHFGDQADRAGPADSAARKSRTGGASASRLRSATPASRPWPGRPPRVWWREFYREY